MRRSKARTEFSLVLALAFLNPGATAYAAEGETNPDDDLRQRLTEREDKRRPAKPWTLEVAGRPLTIGGEYEIGLDYTRRFALDDRTARRNRFLVAQGLEVEAFYTFGAPLSLFVQARAGTEKDRLANTAGKVSERFVERGEMWVHSGNVAGSGLSLELGRLHFEDDRRWWWDAELDAVRATYETGKLEIALALARELGPSRSDRHYVDPQHERVSRLIGEASWDWGRGHALQLFALHQKDRSRAESPGEIVLSKRKDESDARLTWLGARAMGVFDLEPRGKLGYWLDIARVRGTELRVEFEPLSPDRSVAGRSIGRSVRGWAFDAGVNWLVPGDWEPRLFAGYAFGCGDSGVNGESDRSFRQTGIHANEAGFGGVRRFAHYGALLDPELSNLRIPMLGAGISILSSSSLDVVYHHYSLVKTSRSLRESRLEATLTGMHRRIGDGIDVVLALEEWKRVEIEFVASAFRAGRAFGPAEGQWSFRGFLGVRLAF